MLIASPRTFAAAALAATILLGACDAGETTAPATAAVSAPSSQAAVKLTALLTGSSTFASAKGKAVWKQSGQLELQMEVENVVRLAGRRVTFSIGGVTMGSAVVSSLGKATLALRGAGVPASVTGQAVRAAAPSGVTIASGSF